MPMPPAPSPQRSLTFFDRLRIPAFGFLAGLLAGVVMLAFMALLRLWFRIATPTEMIFDRAFPFVTVQFFIDALVRAGGYSQLKLQGVYGALAGHLAAAALGGIVYAWFVNRRRAPAPTGPSSSPSSRPWFDPRGLRLVVPGVLGVWLLLLCLLHPQLATNYYGHPYASAIVLTSLAMLASFTLCGAALMFFHGLLTASTPPSDPNPSTADPTSHPGLTRRRFLTGSVGALAAVTLGVALRRLFKLGTFSYDGTQYNGPDIAKLTPNDKFYQVTKNLVDPDAARDLWRLDIFGHVENPRTWTFAELTTLPAVTQETTLQCISYGVGSGLISNAEWKGIPLPTLLAAVQPKPGAVAVLFYAADGFFETFPFTKATEPTTLVAWEMNGAPLPPRHGFPVRMIVPGIYGERSAKWVTRLELLSQDDPRLKINRHGIEGVGFYTEQGWGPNIYVPTMSRIDAPLVAGDHFAVPFKLNQPTELRGVAFGGDKGISKVELSFDDGQTWTDAPITKPGTLISWSLWTHQWTPDKPGEFAGLVRATNARGEAQIAQFRDQVPHGATGLHRVRGRVDAA